MPANATSVSAYLRRSGFRPVPRSREGVHVTAVTQGGEVVVTVDLDREPDQAALTSDIAWALIQGHYRVRIGAAADAATNILYVSNP